MPVETDRLKRCRTHYLEISEEHQNENNHQGEEANANMQAVKTSQGEKCRGKKVGVDVDTSMQEAQIFNPLTNNKSRSQNERRDHPTNHGSPALAFGSDFTTPDGETADEQANGESERFRGIERIGVSRSGSGRVV